MAEYKEKYDLHFQRMNSMPESSINSSNYIEIDSFLPDRSNSRILDIGCGQGHLLSYLWRKGFRILTGIDSSFNQIQTSKKYLPNEINLLNCDAIEYLNNSKIKFDVILLFDVIEHIKKDDLKGFITAIYKSLQPGGKLIVRTPNMANVLGTYSRYLDMTHEIGFTEYSLKQLMESVQFSKNLVIDQSKFYSLKKKPFFLLRNHILGFIFKLEGRCSPTVFDKNIYLVSIKNVTLNYRLDFLLGGR